MTFTTKGDFTFAKYEYCRYRVKPFIRNQFLPLFFILIRRERVYSKFENSPGTILVLVSGTI